MNLFIIYLPPFPFAPSIRRCGKRNDDKSYQMLKYKNMNNKSRLNSGQSLVSL